MRRKVVILSVIIFVIMNMFAGTGKKAENFALKDIDGKEVQLKHILGKGPVIVNFWATWCIPCRAEMKQLKKLYKKYKNSGLTIISISVDDIKTVSKVKSFVRSNKYPFLILLDTNNDVMRQFNVTNPPFSMLLDKDGTIIHSQSGYHRGDEKILEKKINEILKKQVDL